MTQPAKSRRSKFAVLTLTSVSAVVAAWFACGPVVERRAGATAAGERILTKAVHEVSYHADDKGKGLNGPVLVRIDAETGQSFTDQTTVDPVPHTDAAGNVVGTWVVVDKKVTQKGARLRVLLRATDTKEPAAPKRKIRDQDPLSGSISITTTTPPAMPGMPPPMTMTMITVTPITLDPCDVCKLPPP